jgi:putative alpha-1,2-mannosidase
MLLASPLVKSAEIPCASDRPLRIEVEKSSPDAIYPVKFEFNGREFTEPYIGLSELLSGGVLRFTMSNEPCNNSPVPEIF